MVEIVEYIQDFIEENPQRFLIMMGFWVAVLLGLWVLPAKIGFLQGGVSNQLTYHLLFWDVNYIVFLKLLVSLFSLPIIIFIIMRMSD